MRTPRIRTTAMTAVVGTALGVGGALAAAPSAAAASFDIYYRSAPVPGIDQVYRHEGVVEGLGDDAVPLVCNVDSGAPPAPTDDPDEVVLFDDGRWLLRDLAGESTTSFGRAGDTPLCMDALGDFEDELVVKRGNRYFVASSYAAGGGGVTSFTFGRASDTPLVGDWDGDGVETIAVKRGSGYVFASDNVDGGGSLVSSGFGRPGDVPVAGYFAATDEHDAMSIGVRRGNTFYVSDDLPGTATLRAAASFSFGRASDIPLAGQMEIGSGQQVVVARPS